MSGATANSSAAGGASPPERRLGLRLAPFVLWFGTLGGAVTWSVHTIAVWGYDETVCRSHHNVVDGAPIRPTLAAFTLFFLAISVASLVVSFRHWQRFRGSTGDDLRALRKQRAYLMSVVGLVGNSLFCLMILFDAFAIWVLPACAPTP